MAVTYTPIATSTASGSTSSLTFSSIPSTYTDLVIIINGTASTTTGIPITFNGDTSTNYSRTLLYGTGSAAGSQRASNTSGSGIGYLLSTTQTINRFYIFNYSNTTTYKTAISRSDSSGDSAQVGVGLWRNTAAITSVTFSCSPYTLSSGTMFTLYGIKAA